MWKYGVSIKPASTSKTHLNNKLNNIIHLASILHCRIFHWIIKKDFVGFMFSDSTAFTDVLGFTSFQVFDACIVSSFKLLSVC